MADSNSASASDIDYSDWPAAYREDHPGFIYNNLMLTQLLKEAQETTSASAGMASNLWQNLLRMVYPAHLSATKLSRKLKTPFSENHHAVVVSVMKKMEDPEKGKHSNEKDGSENELDEEKERKREGRKYYFENMLVLEPHHPMLPTALAEEAKRVWDMAFERRFKETMIANRSEVLASSVHCALAVGLKVMFYYFDATKSDDDESLFTRLHETPLNLEVVAEQVEVEQLLNHIKDEALGPNPPSH